MKKVFLILLMISIVLSMSVPFAYAADGETKEVQFYNYNGIIMPDINEIWNKDEFPYVFIIASGSSQPYVFFCDVPFVYRSNTDYLMTRAGYECNYYYARLSGAETSYILRGDVQWEISAMKSGSDLECIKFGDRSLWSNHNVNNYGSSGVFCSASEPVIDKLVEYAVNPVLAPMYDYGGIVVPDISTSKAYDLSVYPYVLMFQVGQQIHVYFSNVPFVIRPSSSYLYIRSSADGQYIKIQRSMNYLLNGYEWGTEAPKDIAASSSIRSFKDEDFNDEKFDGQLIWSNCDLADADGFVYYRTVSPLLVDDTPSFIDSVDAIVDSSTHWINSLSLAVVQTPFILSFVLVAFIGLSIRIISRLRR